MLYLMHLSFSEGGRKPCFGRFTYLVKAPDPDAAKARLRAEVRRARVRKSMCDGPGPVEVYLDDLVEVGRSPKRGLIGRVEIESGEEPPRLSCTLPGGHPVFCRVVEPELPDGDEEDDEGAVREPFLVFGAE